VQILRRAAARKRAGISRTTEFRLIRGDPTWPRVVQITPGLTGYFEDELDAWIEARPRVSLPERDEGVGASP
jgi:prophage regulatory protein